MRCAHFRAKPDPRTRPSARCPAAFLARPRSLGVCACGQQRVDTHGRWDTAPLAWADKGARAGAATGRAWRVQSAGRARRVRVRGQPQPAAALPTVSHGTASRMRTLSPARAEPARWAAWARPREGIHRELRRRPAADPPTHLRAMHSCVVGSQRSSARSCAQNPRLRGLRRGPRRILS